MRGRGDGVRWSSVDWIGYMHAVLNNIEVSCSTYFAHSLHSLWFYVYIVWSVHPAGQPLRVFSQGESSANRPVPQRARGSVSQRSEGRLCAPMHM